MNPISAAFVVLVLLCIGFAVTWLVGRRIGKWAIVDPIWSFSVGFSAIVFALLAEGGSAQRKAAICVVVALYSLRLGGYILKRFLAHDEDDPRYVEFAREWGERAAPRMLLFFQFQALGSLALCVPIFVALQAPSAGLGTWDFVGIVWALFSILGEAVADDQLRRFKARPDSSGKVCKEGLWRYSRHPNYFFQWAFWLSFIPLSFSSSLWYLALLGPLLMYHFLVNVTGIPPAEKSSLKSRGEAYRQYQQETSPFFPLPPKQSSSSS